VKQEIEWLLKDKYSGEKSAGFFTDCERLRAGEPLAYVIGWVPFLGSRIWLDSRPLIPRPETEWWVEKAIAVIKTSPLSPPRTGLGNSLGRSSGVEVLDLCAGSGCIGVAVAKHVPRANITFAEIDPTHLTTIEKNLAENLQSIPVNWNTLESNLFNNVSGKFDFILSNPPYIDPVLDRATASVKKYEPPRALYGGRGGGAVIEQIIAAAPRHLTPHGQLWLEHEPEQVATITSLAQYHGFSTTTHPDQFGNCRYSVLVLQ
jgi:release factor glutamine methyltransferase